MQDRPLAAALEREHYDIDEGIEAFTAQPTGQRARHQLTLAIRALRLGGAGEARPVLV